MDKRGFTLVELLVVLAIMAVIAVIAVPRLPIDRFYLDSVSKDLVYDIRFVKNMDMAEPDKLYNIVLLSDGYRIKYSNPMPKYSKLVDLKNGYTISFNKSQDVMFNANGTPKNAQTITILHTSTGNKREITIVPNTGRILLIE